MDNSESETNHVPSDPALNTSTITVSVKDIDDAVMRLETTNGYDGIHTSHLISAGLCFRNLLCKLMNKFISHGFPPQSMLLGKIRSIVKKSAGNKACSSNYRPVMNYSNVLKMFEYLILPHLKNI